MRTLTLAAYLNRALFRAIVVGGLLGSLMIYAHNHSAVNGKDPNTVEWPTGQSDTQGVNR